MAIAQEKRLKMLSEFKKVGASGQAESENKESFTRGFLPIAEHAKALEPDVVLVVGDRGSGKSELFRSIMDFNLVPDILKYSPGFRSGEFDIRTAKWLKAYPIESDFPDISGLKRVLSNSASEKQKEIQKDLWFAYLVRILHKKYPQFEDKASASRLKKLFRARAASATEVMDAFYSVNDEPLDYLDAFDRRLQKENVWLFAGYDELDTLGSYDWQVLEKAVAGLISFWAAYARRWKRLKSKVFIRTDLFNRNNQVFGADLPKLAANRAELTWSDKNLYAMLFKRIVNLDSDFKAYAKSNAGKVVEFENDRILGAIPRFKGADDFRLFFEKLIGPFMGASNKKGRTFKWMLDHIRDGHSKALPRALVVLFEEAAKHELETPRAEGNSLINPIALRRALTDVSNFYVLQAQSHEWPWLAGVQRRVAGSQVPLARDEFKDLLQQDWEGAWGQNARDKSIRPPEASPSLLLEYLVDLGVLRLRQDGRLDVPDLYLDGLSLKRKGGVKKE